MRKFVKAGLAGLAALMLMTGCGAKDQTATPSDAESKAEKTEGADESTEEYIAEGSITLGEYKKLPVTVINPTVSDEELQSRIDTVLGGYATWDAVDREAVDGDRVKIDYKGLKDGEAFEGGTAEGYTLVLGSNTFIDGFEEGLIGVKAGENRNLNLTFPEDYQAEDLAGQDVVFEVTVHEVAEKHVPELTDEFVAENFPELGTVDAYKEDLKQQMLDAKLMQSEQQRDAELLAAVVENSEITCATDEVNEVYDQQIQYYTSMAGMYGMGLSDYAAIMGLDEDGFRTEVRKMSEQTVKQQMALMEIAKKEKLTVEDADREALAEEYKDAYESVDDMIEKAGAENVDNVILYDKAIQVVVDNADITKVDGLAVAE
ncbi:MAG: trigger factor [Clostridium sp.]|jgi:trigger factor|nr:trigger factor [Clostridium sp.]